MSRNRRIIFAFLNAAGLLVTILINYFASTLPINGQTTGEISLKYNNLFVPASYTFTIWGVIYLSLAVFIVYQLIDSFRIHQEEDSFLDRIGVWFVVSCIANSTWIFMWHYEVLLLSVVLILILLSALIIIALRLLTNPIPTSEAERYFVHLPFRLYFGWITVAVIANISAWLVSIHWNGLGLPEQFWTILMAFVAATIAIFMFLRRSDFYFSLVVLWGLTGILVRQIRNPIQIDILVIVGLIVSITAIIGVFIWQYLNGLKIKS
jgi:hypothetical protein